MPDLTYIAARWCISNECDQYTAVGSTGNTYQLSYRSHGRGQPTWSRECLGYKHRGTCRHLDKAEEARCKFGSLAAAGAPELDDVWMGTDYCCPDCQRPSSIMSYAS